MKKIFLVAFLLFFAMPVFADVLIPTPMETFQMILSDWWEDTPFQLCVALFFIALGIYFLIKKRKNKYIQRVNKVSFCILVIVLVLSTMDLWTARREVRRWMCPRDKPLLIGKECHSCFEEEAFDMDERDGDWCSSACPNRYLTDEGFEETGRFGFYCRINPIENGSLILNFESSFDKENVLIKENYRNSQRDGLWGVYYIWGLPLLTKEYKNGVLQKEIRYHDGQIDVVKEYNDKEEIVQTTTYDGKRVTSIGKRISSNPKIMKMESYDESGKVKEIGWYRYKQDWWDGDEIIEEYENGVLVERKMKDGGNFSRNEKTEFFDKNGNIIRIEGNENLKLDFNIPYL